METPQGTNQEELSRQSEILKTSVFWKKEIDILEHYYFFEKTILKNLYLINKINQFFEALKTKFLSISSV